VRAAARLSTTNAALDPTDIRAGFIFMSVQWTVASAASKAALPARQNHFHRTRKGRGAIVGTRITAMSETVIGGLLVVGSITIFATNCYRFFETDLFTAILKPAFPVGRGIGLAGAHQQQQNENNGCCSGGNLRRLFGACGWAPWTEKVVSVACVTSRAERPLCAISCRSLEVGF
jgi:hypothetical protein